MTIYAQKSGKFRIRTAQPATCASPSLSDLGVSNPDESDVDFILHAFDSALPYLASIGSEAQWGTVPFSVKPERVSHFTQYVQECYALQSYPDKGGPGWQDMYLYEVLTDATWTRVAVAGLSVHFPDYVPLDLADDSTRKATDYVYLKYLVTDRRSGGLAKGSATQLMTFVETVSRDMGKKVCYGDCWRGNGDGLLK